MARSVLVALCADEDGNIITNEDVRIFETDASTVIGQALYAVLSGGSPLTQPLRPNSDGVLYLYADSPQECRLQIGTRTPVAGWFEPTDPVTQSTTQTITGAKSFTGAVTTAGATMNGVTEIAAVNHAGGGKYTCEKYGAISDLDFLTGLSVSNGASVITAGSAVFSVLDLGKHLGIYDTDGSGNPRAVVYGTITTFTSSTQVTVTGSAVATVTGQAGLMGTDNAAAFRAAYVAAMATGGEVIMRDRMYLCSNVNWTGGDGVHIRGVEMTVTGNDGLFRGTGLMPTVGLTGTWIDWGNNQHGSIKGLQIGRSDIGSWAPQIGVGLSLVAGQRENTGAHLEDVYVAGNFLYAAAYVTAMNIGSMTRVQFYNYGLDASQTALSITSDNWADVQSNYFTVNNVANYNETSRWVLTNVQCHTPRKSGGVGTRSVGYPLRLEGAYNIELNGCDFTSSNRHVLVEDIGQALNSPVRYTRNVSFFQCNFDQPDTTQAEPIAAVIFNDDNAHHGFSFKQCRVRAVAFLENGGSAGDNFEMVGLDIESCTYNWLAPGDILTTTTYVIDFNSGAAAATNRISRSRIDAGGLLVRSNGSIARSVEIIDPGGWPSCTSGTMRARVQSSNTAFVNDVWCVFDAAGTASAFDGISGITANATGDYTITFSPNMPGTTYVVQVSVVAADNATVVIVSKTASATRIRIKDGSTGNAVAPTEVNFRATYGTPA